ncbi:hypothetical protein Q4488_17165 [Amphritea sp. 1_MG-2023]|uniref:hypothetical protein n=1 Tax=Amphritea sp. 1_MG-2023 TaxID=3062670 RepID=UPI0026E1F601|nr:hypothetical protein [Amphritea sp. 1_MG-2023]MDO6565109.1 hypothetical protein [Amphritea sp. 1_MG-2023]
MTKKQEISDDIDLADDWSDDDIEIDTKEKQFCCDAEKRRRIELLFEQRRLERELREFYD